MSVTTRPFNGEWQNRGSFLLLFFFAKTTREESKPISMLRRYREVRGEEGEGLVLSL